MISAPENRIKRSPRYVVIAIGIGLIVFVGFSRTFYLKSAFGPTRALSVLAIVHGLLMTGWFALFLAQAVLVNRRRLDVHRRLGVAGAILAAAVVVSGVMTVLTVTAEARVVQGTLAVAGDLIGTLLLFLVLVGAGLIWRRNPETHRNLMTLASLSILGAAIQRWPMAFCAQHGQLIVDFLIVSFIAFETIRIRRWNWFSSATAAFILAAQHALNLL